MDSAADTDAMLLKQQQLFDSAQSAFFAVDRDGNGTIDSAEVGEAIRVVLGSSKRTSSPDDVIDEAVRQICLSADTNKDGVLDFEECVRV